MEAKRIVEESNVKFGIEIEIENNKSVRDSKYWHCKPDNSLRHGVEYVFVKPLDGKTTLIALEEFYNQHLEERASISPRTGIHAHLDVSNCTNLQIQKKCIYYALMEEPIFAWVGEYRHLSHFCLPWYTAPGDLGTISKSLNSNNLYATSPNINRYAALNLNAVHKFGSVEYRHLKTTKDMQRVVDWLAIITCIKNKAMSHEGSCSDILAEFSNNGQEKFMKGIFPPSIYKQFPEVPVNIGLLTAIDLLPKVKNAPSMFKFLSWGPRPIKKRKRNV